MYQLQEKMLVKESVDGFEGYIDMKRCSGRDPTIDIQVFLNYFIIKKGDSDLYEIEDN